MSVYGKLLSGATSGLVRGKVYMDELALKEAQDRRRDKAVAQRDRALSIQQAGQEATADFRERQLGQTDEQIALQEEQIKNEKDKALWAQIMGFANSTDKDGHVVATKLMRKYEKDNDLPEGTYGAFGGPNYKTNAVVVNKEHVVLTNPSWDEEKVLKINPEAADLFEAQENKLDFTKKQVDLLNTQADQFRKEWAVEAPGIEFDPSNRTFLYTQKDKSKAKTFYDSLIKWAQKDPMTEGATAADQKKIARAREVLARYERTLDYMFQLTDKEFGVNLSDGIMDSYGLLKEWSKGAGGVKTGASRSESLAEQNSYNNPPIPAKDAGNPGTAVGRIPQEAVESEMGNQAAPERYIQEVERYLSKNARDPANPTPEESKKADAYASQAVGATPGTYLY